MPVNPTARGSTQPHNSSPSSTSSPPPGQQKSQMSPVPSAPALLSKDLSPSSRSQSSDSSGNPSRRNYNQDGYNRYANNNTTRHNNNYQNYNGYNNGYNGYNNNGYKQNNYKNRGNQNQQHNSKQFNKNGPEINYYPPHQYYVQAISPIVQSAPLYYPYTLPSHSQIPYKPRHHRPITLVNPETKMPVLPAQDTSNTSLGSPQKSNASPTLKERNNPAPIKTSPNTEAQQKAKRSFMEQITAKALAAQQESKADDVESEQLSDENTSKKKEEVIIEEPSLAEESHNIDNRIAKARLAEELSVAEAACVAEKLRLAEEAQIAEKAHLAEESRIAEKSRLAEESRIAEESRLAEESRIAEESRLAEEFRIAEEKSLAEESRIAEESRLAEESRIAEEKSLAEAARAAEERLAEESRIAEEKSLAEAARAAEERLAEETKIAEKARLADAAKKLENKRVEQERLEKERQEMLQKIVHKANETTLESKQDSCNLKKYANLNETIDSTVESLNHTIQSSITSQHCITTAKRLTASEILALKYPKGIKPNSIVNKNNALVYTIKFLKQFSSVVTFPPKEKWADYRAIVPTEAFEPQRSHFNRQSNRSNAPQSMGYFTPNFSSNVRINNSGNFQNLSTNMNRVSSRSNFNVTSFSSMRSGQQSLQRRSGNNYFDGPPGAKFTSLQNINSFTMASTPEPVPAQAPLKRTSNAWTPKIKSKVTETVGGLLTEEAIIRKSKSLLNKMTAENFDVISDQLLEIGKQSEKETTGLALRIVVNQTFDKATDEAHWSAVYAKFCFKLVQTVSPEIQQEGLLNKAGEPIKGFFLVRHYLFSKCQSEFEKGWKDKLPTNKDGTIVEAVMMSDEYYKIVAAKRRGLGLVRFIGELYILKLLSSNIIKACFSRLLTDPENENKIPSEEEIESACKLMITVGPTFDDEVKQKREDFLKTTMERFAKIATDKSLSSRFRFMILDVISMYKSGWTKAKKNDGPKSIAEIHEEERKAKAAASAAMSHGHRDHRGGNHHTGSGFGSRSNSSRKSSMDTISPNDINKLRKFHAPGLNGSPGSRDSLSPSASSSSGGQSLAWNNSPSRGSRRSTSLASSSLGNGNNVGSSNSSNANNRSNKTTTNNGSGLASRQPSSHGSNSFAALANDD